MSLNKGSLDKAIRELKVEKLQDSSAVTILDLESREFLIDYKMFDINSAELSGATLEQGDQYSYLLIDTASDFIRIPFVVAFDGVYRLMLYGAKSGATDSDVVIYIYNQQTGAEVKSMLKNYFSTDITCTEMPAGYDASLVKNAAYIIKIDHSSNATKIHGIILKRIS